MTKDEEILRGNQAKELLENPLLVDAFEAIERSIITQWSENTSIDNEGRDRLWLMLQMQKKLKGVLEDHVKTGVMAKMEMEIKAQL